MAVSLNLASIEDVAEDIADVERVKVLTEHEKMLWKSPAELQPTDRIVLRKDGVPMVMKEKPGPKPTRKKSDLHAVDNPQVIPLPETSGMTAKDRADRSRRELQKKLKKSKLVRLASEHPESSELMDEVMSSLAKTIVSLEHEMSQAESKGEDPAMPAAKKVTALKALAESWLRRREDMTPSDINLESPVFEALFEYIMVSFQEAMAGAGLRTEQIETVFSTFSSKLNDEWKIRAYEVMKKARGQQ